MIRVTILVATLIFGAAVGFASGVALMFGQMAQAYAGGALASTTVVPAPPGGLDLNIECQSVAVSGMFPVTIIRGKGDSGTVRSTALVFQGRGRAISPAIFTWNERLSPPSGMVDDDGENLAKTGCHKWFEGTLRY